LPQILLISFDIPSGPRSPHHQGFITPVWITQGYFTCQSPASSLATCKLTLSSYERYETHWKLNVNE